MAISDLEFRFTEEKYATKSEVMRDLKTSLVDNIWNNILEYRKQYFTKLNLHSFSKGEYLFCNCQFITSKTAQTEMKLLRVMRECTSLSSEDYNALEFASYLSLLRSVAKSNELDDSEVRMRAVLRNEVKYLDEANSILPRYITALNYIKKHCLDTIDINYIHTLHKFLTGLDESKFRENMDKDLSNRVMIDRVYTSAPINLIEPLLTELIEFINTSTLSSVIKSLIAYNFILMIKPFEKDSEEVGLLLAKAIIGKESMGETIAIIPFEQILIESREEMIRRFGDVQRYNDVTYFVRYGLEIAEGIITEFIDRIVNFKTKTIKEEFYKEDIPTPIVEAPKVAPVVEEKVSAPIVENKPEQIVVARPTEQEIILVSAPTAIDEKEASKITEHLLELDPSLRKNEAKFYARHCTLGKSYTIQQFKKYNRCAYETARSGMDHLVELGYYRKEQVKNKYVYSPVMRK